MPTTIRGGRVRSAALGGLILALTAGADASEFRTYRPILSPAAVGAERDGTGIVRPVSLAAARRIADRIVAAWNRNRLDDILAHDFYDGARLVDAMNIRVPRDARLSVLAVRNVQTLEQQVKEDGQGRRLLVSTVAITLRTQITFEDPVRGYRRLPGTNEYIVRVRQRLDVPKSR